MNFLDWLQVTFSFVAILIGLYIALSREPSRGVLVTTRVASFGAALVGLSYFVGGFEAPAVQTALFDRIEAGSAVVGLLVVLGALFSQARPVIIHPARQSEALRRAHRGPGGGGCSVDRKFTGGENDPQVRYERQLRLSWRASV